MHDFDLSVGGLIKTSLIDFPGKVSAVIFFQGCNFRCDYCYNVDLVIPEFFKPKMNLEEILSFLEKRKRFLDGVVLLGGEPTLQRDLVKFARYLKELGYLVKLDTNGSFPKIIKEMIDNNLVDYIAMDVKAPLEFEKYNKVAHITEPIFKNILESIELLQDFGKYEFRTTFVRDFVPLEWALDIAKDIEPANKYALQNFFPNAERYVNENFEPRKPYAPWELNKIAEEIRSKYKIKEVIVRA